jgi:hypothetical protein
VTKNRDLSKSVLLSGTTANRPASPYIGMKYYDITLGQMLIYSFGGWTSASSANPQITITGGTLVSDSTYYYRVFTGAGNLVVSGSGSISADVLIAAGGGGGGGSAGGGGGAGGYRYLTSQSLSPATYSV